MPNNLTWCDLPNDVSQWPGLPLSLSGDEVMPWIITQVVAAGFCMDAP
jgi:hypothetical protein